MVLQRLSSCVLVALFASGVIAANTPAHGRTAAQTRSDAQLARALDDRIAGKPVDCLNLRDIRSSRIIDRTAILYETTGGTLYLNRPDAGQSSLSWGDVLVTDTHSHQLCSIDVVRLYDTSLRMQTGVVFLGEFVPYRKPRRNR